MYPKLSKEKQKLIQETFNKLRSVEATIKELGFNYRTIVKYLFNKPSKRKCNPDEAVRVYQITGSLKRTAKILNISATTVWRNLKFKNIDVGNGASTWRRLYATLRRRVSKSQWRKDILQRDNYKCIECGEPSNTVHHIKRLADLRDQIVKTYPDINPFNSYAELRQFTDLVMNLHNEIADGVVYCSKCHDKEHSKS